MSAVWINTHLQSQSWQCRKYQHTAHCTDAQHFICCQYRMRGRSAANGLQDIGYGHQRRSNSFSLKTTCVCVIAQVVSSVVMWLRLMSHNVCCPILEMGILLMFLSNHTYILNHYHVCTQLIKRAKFGTLETKSEICAISIHKLN